MTAAISETPRRRRRAAGWQAVATLCLCAAAAAAATDASPAEPVEPEPEEPSLIVEEQVVVTATRRERPLESLPLSATVLGGEEIERSPVLSADELLRSIPGVDLPGSTSSSQYHTFNRLSLRGLGGNRALALIDGVPLNDPYSGYIHWLSVPLLALERVEVVRGASSSLFGSYALSGTVQFLTRPPSQRDTRLRLAAGSHQTLSTEASFAGGTASGTSWSASGNFFDSDGPHQIPAATRGPVDRPSASKAINAAAAVERAAPSGHRAFLRASWHDFDLSLGTPLSGTDRQVVDVGAGGHLALDERAWLAGQAYYRRHETAERNVTILSDRGGEFLVNPRSIRARELGASLEGSRTTNGRLAMLSSGLDLRYIDGEETGSQLDASGGVLSARIAGAEQLSAGLFVQSSWVPRPGLEILAGGRWDQWENRAGFERSTVGALATTNQPADRRFHELNPRLAVRWQPAAGPAWRAAVYRGFRAPTLNELYTAFVAKNSAGLNNPALGPERLLGADAGLSAAGGGWRGEVNGFFYELEDFIGRVTVRTQPLLTLQYFNLGLARSRGGEAIATWTRGRTRLDAAYTYTDSTIVDNPRNRALEGKLTPEIPRHRAHLGLRSSFGRLGVNGRGRYAGERFADGSNRLAYDAHTVLDLLVDWALTPRAALFVSGENLTAERYTVELAAERRIAPRQQIMAGLRWQLGAR